MSPTVQAEDVRFVSQIACRSITPSPAWSGTVSPRLDDGRVSVEVDRAFSLEENSFGFVTVGTRLIPQGRDDFLERPDLSPLEMLQDDSPQQMRPVRQVLSPLE